MTYLILVSFIVCSIILEKERMQNPLGLIGGAINRCNIVERFVFYAFPVISDVYLLLLTVERKKPHWLVEIDWSKVGKSTIY